MAIMPASSSTVLAVEPDPFNRITSEVNVATHRRVNHLDNIILSPLAVSDTPGFQTFSSEAAMGSALTTIVGGHRGESVEVECVTLQGLVDRYGLSRVDFIKMDIEGAEVAIIPAAGAFLSRYRPRLIIEPHPINGVSSAIAVSAALEAIGYSCSAIEQTGLDLPLLTAVPRL